MHQAVHDPELLEILLAQICKVQRRTTCTTLLKDYEKDEFEKHKKSLGLLLSNGARLNVDMEDDKGLTAMHYAAHEPDIANVDQQGC